ncbi:hypothetical protein L510_4582 [Bordetella bronchiseptica MBORD591]|nr:hypothetical protein L510_4582 [Bordetella bronchiseptica MBORD591]
MGTGSRSGACPRWDRHTAVRHRRLTAKTVSVPAGTGPPSCAILAGRRP